MSVDIQFVSKHVISPHGTTQLRCNQPAQYLRQLGYSVHVDTIYRTAPRARKLIFAHRVTMDRYTADFFTCARAQGCRIVYDTDDLLFDADGVAYLRAGQKGAQYAAGAEPYASAMAACDAVSVSTGYLATRAMAVNPNAHVLRNALGAPYLELAAQVNALRQTRHDEAVTLAYLSGSKSHDADFKVIEPHLLEILDRYPKARLLLVGALTISDAFERFGPRVERRGFVPYDSFARVFEQIDINLIPLETQHPFCHAKSELKFLEAAACGVVSIASPTEPHKAVMRDAETGYLADGADWVEKLGALIESADARAAMGRAARAIVLDDYTTLARSKDYGEFVTNVLAAPHAKLPQQSDALLANARLRLARAKRSLRRGMSKWKPSAR